MSLVDAMCGVPKNNVSQSKPDYYISYNPDTRAGAFGDKDGGPETALVFHDQPHGKDGHMWTGDAFYILKGDFRKEYEALIEAGEGRWGLKHFYDQYKKTYGSRHSTDFHDWGKDGRRRKRGEAVRPA